MKKKSNHKKEQTKMRGKKRYIMIILGMIIVSVSCSEFLYQEPEDQMSVNEQFSTRDGVMQTVNGMYASMESLISGKYFIYADLLGGNLTFTPSKYDKIVEIPPKLDIEKIYEFRDQEDASDFKSFYDDAYEVINEVNVIIERVPDIKFLTDDEKNQIIAESLTGRALAHYLVTLVYAQNAGFTPDGSHPGIVCNRRTLIAGVDYPSRETVAKTWEYMKKDLNEALSLYTGNQALSYGPEYSYFNANTTRAILARAALQMNDWETALENADYVINNNETGLMSKNEYLSEWEKPSDPVKETILEFTAPRTSDDNTVTSSVGHEYYFYTDTNNYSNFVASGDLLDLYDTNDIRRNLFLEKILPTSIDSVITNVVYYFTKKFQDDPGTTFIRLSEMYLIRAEARARIGTDINLALEDLNAIRQRANIDEITDPSTILEEIFLERRRELAFEGHLFFDIARYKKDVVREKGCISTVCSMTYPSYYYVLPIPASSVLLNENMIQNDGY